MKLIRIAVLTFLFAILLFFAFVTIQGNRPLSCESPIVVGFYGKSFFEERFNEVVLALGGLPKDNINDLGLVMNRWGGELKTKDESGIKIPLIHSVKEWKIDYPSVSVTQFGNYHIPLVSGSKYSYHFNVHVTYADGDTAVFQLSSWSYGTAACPILISTGIGEPGQLTILP